MTEHASFARFVAAIEKSDEFWSELVKARFADEVGSLMEAREPRMTKSDLARRLGCTQAYVSKVLRGDTNFTIDTMTKILRTFNRVPRIEAVEDTVFYARSFLLVETCDAPERRSLASNATLNATRGKRPSGNVPVCVLNDSGAENLLEEMSA